MESSQIDPPSDAPQEAQATPTIAPEANEPAPGEALIDLSAIQVIPVDPYAFDIDVVRLDEHDSMRIEGRPLAELTDAEIADLTEERAATDATPAQPAKRKAPAALGLSDLNIIWPDKQVPVRMQVDHVVHEWFSRGGELPGPRMAAVLRGFVEAQLKVEARGS